MLDIFEVVVVYTFVLGSLYLLISLGFSLICGVLRIFHLGYAYIFVATAYLTWMFMKELGWGLGPAIAGMLVIQIGIAIAAYRGLIKPYLRAEEKMMTALLLIAMIAEQAGYHWYPIHAGVYLPTTISPGTINIGATVISKQLIFAAIIAIAFTVLFVLFFLKSKPGLGVRALSQDVYTSQLMGINVERLYIYIMAITIIPVVIGMLLVAPVWAVDPSMGMGYMITAVLVCVLGGLGNLKGTIIASYIIGFAHYSDRAIKHEPRFMNLAGLAIVLIVLVIRPQGIARSEALW